MRESAAVHLRLGQGVSALLLVGLAVALLWAVTPATSQGTTGHITGTVTLDSTGTPLEGIDVGAYWYHSTPWGGHWDWVASVLTTSTGTYDLELAPETYRIKFTDPAGTYVPGWYPAQVLVTADTTVSGIDAALSLAGAIEGTVTDQADGSPIADALVVAFWTADPYSEYTQNASTDASGSYRIAGLVPGDRTIRFSATGYAEEYYDDVTDMASATAVSVAAAEVKHIDVELRSNRTLTTLRASPTLVAYGGKPTLSVTVTPAGSSTPISDGTVEIWDCDSYGGATTLAGVAAWDATRQAYRLTPACTRSRRFKATFTHAWWSWSDSAPVLVRAKAYLSRPVAPTSVARYAYFNLYGYLKPRHTGKTRVYFDRWVAGRWRYPAYAYATNRYYSSTTTKYTLRHHLHTAGRWRIRTYHYDSNHALTWSSARYMTVR